MHALFPVEDIYLFPTARNSVWIIAVSVTVNETQEKKVYRVLFQGNIVQDYLTDVHHR